MHVYLPFAAAHARRCGFLTQLELCKGENVVSDYGPGHDAETWFKEAFTKGGGQVIEALRAPLASPDFAPFLQRARDAQPEAVYVFVPSGQAATLIKQFVERGIAQAGIKLIGPGDITDDDQLNGMGDQVKHRSFATRRSSPFVHAAASISC